MCDVDHGDIGVVGDSCLMFVMKFNNCFVDLFFVFTTVLEVERLIVAIVCLDPSLP